MKKGAIITAIVLLSAGLLIFVGGLFAGGSLPSMKYESQRFAVNEPFTDIRIDTHETDVEFIPSEDGTCSVDSAVTEKFYPNVSVVDGVLTVTTVDERTWLDRLMFHPNQPMQIRLPGTAYRTLFVESRTGGLTVPEDFAFEQVQIIASTGNVTCGASASGAMQITASTGDITLLNVRAETLSLSVSTGRITVTDTTVTGDVTVNGSTGKTELQSLICRALTTDGNTGRVEMKDVVAKDALRIKRSTGDVTLERCDAQNLEIETGTGDVTASLLSEKTFVTKTSTGKVRVPDSQSGGRCAVTTSTGDIRIDLVGAAQP